MPNAVSANITPNVPPKIQANQSPSAGRLRMGGTQPGILNDCFHRPESALCAKRAKPLGRPLPMLNMCSTCPNSRRSSVHLPRLMVARSQAETSLREPAGQLQPLQKIALTDYVASFDALIDELQNGERIT